MDSVWDANGSAQVSVFVQHRGQALCRTLGSDSSLRVTTGDDLGSEPEAKVKAGEAEERIG